MTGIIDIWPFEHAKQGNSNVGAKRFKAAESENVAKSVDESDIGLEFKRVGVVDRWKKRECSRVEVEYDFEIVGFAPKNKKYDVVCQVTTEGKHCGKTVYFAKAHVALLLGRPVRYEDVRRGDSTLLEWGFSGKCYWLGELKGAAEKEKKLKDNYIERHDLKEYIETWADLQKGMRRLEEHFD